MAQSICITPGRPARLAISRLTADDRHSLSLSGRARVERTLQSSPGTRPA
ncbi:MAG: hypothetical protein Q8N23_30380 [Archangium sp.]|nr:hypothetical protein [Archangium sp.]MDP3157018.1 hypothetical protein [Archangium sp.]MDP3575735.1 hypothetical protein [Archangium sp.]